MLRSIREGRLLMARKENPIRRLAQELGLFLYPFWWLLKNRWFQVFLALLIVIFVVYNRESIRATFSEHVGAYCGSLGSTPDRLVSPTEIERVTTCFANAYGTCQAATLDFRHWWGDGTSRTIFLVESAFGLGACGLAVKNEVQGNGGCSVGDVAPCTIVFPCRALSRHDLQLTLSDCGGRGDIRTPIPFP